jgi:hypothetical protein
MVLINNTTGALTEFEYTNIPEYPNTDKIILADLTSEPSVMAYWTTAEPTSIVASTDITWGSLAPTKDVLYLASSPPTYALRELTWGGSLKAMSTTTVPTFTALTNGRETFSFVLVASLSSFAADVNIITFTSSGGGPGCKLFYEQSSNTFKLHFQGTGSGSGPSIARGSISTNTLVVFSGHVNNAGLVTLGVNGTKASLGTAIQFNAQLVTIGDTTGIDRFRAIAILNTNNLQTIERVEEIVAGYHGVTTTITSDFRDGNIRGEKKDVLVVSLGDEYNSASSLVTVDEFYAMVQRAGLDISWAGCPEGWANGILESPTKIQAYLDQSTIARNYGIGSCLVVKGANLMPVSGNSSYLGWVLNPTTGLREASTSYYWDLASSSAFTELSNRFTTFFAGQGPREMVSIDEESLITIGSNSDSKRISSYWTSPTYSAAALTAFRAYLTAQSYPGAATAKFPVTTVAVAVDTVVDGKQINTALPAFVIDGTNDSYLEADNSWPSSTLWTHWYNWRVTLMTAYISMQATAAVAAFASNPKWKGAVFSTPVHWYNVDTATDLASICQIADISYVFAGYTTGSRANLATLAPTIQRYGKKLGGMIELTEYGQVSTSGDPINRVTDFTQQTTSGKAKAMLLYPIANFNTSRNSSSQRAVGTAYWGGGVAAWRECLQSLEARKDLTIHDIDGISEIWDASDLADTTGSIDPWISQGRARTALSIQFGAKSAYYDKRKGVVDFAGSTTVYRKSSPEDSYVTLAPSNNFGLFFCGTLSSKTTLSYLNRMFGSGGFGATLVHAQSSSTFRFVYDNTGAANAGYISSTAIPVNTPFVLVGYLDDHDRPRIRLNGVEGIQGSAFTGFTTTLVDFNAGSADVGEVYGFGTLDNVSLDTIEKIEGTYASRAGIVLPTTHLFYNTRPRFTTKPLRKSRLEIPGATHVWAVSNPKNLTINGSNQMTAIRSYPNGLNSTTLFGSANYPAYSSTNEDVTWSAVSTFVQNTLVADVASRTLAPSNNLGLFFCGTILTKSVGTYFLRMFGSGGFGATIYRSNSSDTFRFIYDNSGSTNAGFISSTGTAVNTKFILVAYLDGTNRPCIRLNGVEGTPGTAITGFTSTKIDINADGVDFGKLFTCGILSNVTTANLEEVEGILAWGEGIQTLLPSTHKYRWARPIRSWS